MPRQPIQQQAMQVVYEDEPLLRVFLSNGDVIDYRLRNAQLLLIAGDALSIAIQVMK